MNTLRHRDLVILNFIAQFGYCQERQLATLCGLSIIQIKRIIGRLKENGYVTANRILADSGNYVFLTTSSGLMLNTKVINKPNLNTLWHDSLLVDLYLFLLNAEKITPQLIKTDKQLRQEAGIFGVNTKYRVPDLLIDDKIAIELELSKKTPSKLQEIINSYIIDDNKQLVCYFLQSISLLKKIYSLTLPHTQKFKFYLFEVSQNMQFVHLQQQTENGLIVIDELNLMELPATAPKRFGNYQF